MYNVSRGMTKDDKEPLPMTTHRRPRSLHTFRFEVEVEVGGVIGSVRGNREDGYRAETQDAPVRG